MYDPSRTEPICTRCGTILTSETIGGSIYGGFLCIPCSKDIGSEFMARAHKDLADMAARQIAMERGEPVVFRVNDDPTAEEIEISFK